MLNFQQQEQKQKEGLKKPGHYKAHYELVEKRIPSSVNYDNQSFREQILEKIRDKKNDNSMKCCKRIIRTIQQQYNINQKRYPQQLSNSGLSMQDQNPNSSQNHRKHKTIGNSNLLTQTTNLFNNLTNNQTIDKDRQKSNQSPIFNKDQTFPYTNVMISPDYHLIMDDNNMFKPSIQILRNKQLQTISVPQSPDKKGSRSKKMFQLRRESQDNQSEIDNLIRKSQKIDQQQLYSQRLLSSDELMSQRNSKYKRVRGSINMQSMLSRSKQRLIGDFLNDDESINQASFIEMPQLIKEKNVFQRPDIGIIQFDKSKFSREKNSIFNPKENGISPIVNHVRVQMGLRRLSQFREQNQLKFSYDKKVDLSELENEDLYSKLIKGKIDLKHVEKLFIKKGILNQEEGGRLKN